MDKDAKPMQPLVDVWVSQRVLPKVEKVESAGAVLPSVAMARGMCTWQPR